MRIGVFGVGAIGGVIGGYLARAESDVTLIDLWPTNIDRIKDQGLTVTAMEEEFTVKPRALHLGEVSAAGLSFDAAVISVKSYDTKWLSHFIEPHLAPGGFIVSAQNSINEETIAAVVGWTRVIGCVVTLGAAMFEPGHVLRTSANDERPAFTVGEPSGLVTRRIGQMATALRPAGASRTTNNLWGERWAKLSTNSMANALAGITGLMSAELRANGETLLLSIRIASEIVAVAGSLGVHVESIGGVPAEMFAKALDDPARKAEVEVGLAKGAEAIGTGRPSLAQDLMKGRRTEVEYLNGYVVDKGAQLGVPTPVNKAVLELTKRVERGELEPSLSNLKYLDL